MAGQKIDLAVIRRNSPLKLVMNSLEMKYFTENIIFHEDFSINLVEFFLFK